MNIKQPARMGRPPLSPVPSIHTAVRLTPEQKAKLEQLGGAQWIREKIDKAKLPTT